MGWVADESKKQEYLQTILSETDRMSEMISNMLDFSKIEAGKKQYRMEPANLPSIIDGTLESYSGYIHNLGFELHVEIDNDIPQFPLDSAAIRSITVNLLQNAVKYSGEEKYIAVRLFKRDNHAVLEVEDLGIGIETHDIDNIFKQFYRSSHSRVQTIEGSGLGLYLVLNAVQAHNATISVNSTPGKGSCFTITFPITPTPSKEIKEEKEENSNP